MTIRATVAAGMAIAMACAAFGQTEAAPLTFEVASVKPAVPSADGRVMIRMRVAAGRLDYSNASLKAMIQQAYGVQDYQVSGADWIATTRFDVVAKLPAGAPPSKVAGMLQRLLADRFKLAIHRESREMPIYALAVGKNGPKLKEAEVDPKAPPVQAAALGAKASAEGWFLRPAPGHVQCHAMNMASLANLLGALLGRPVVDQTGLAGHYDFELEYTSDEAPHLPPAGAQSPEQVPSASNPNDNSLPLAGAVQAQLGLKLNATRGPVEQIVVDHVEKTPTEN